MAMGTGIVSVDLALDGHETLSRILLVVAALAWGALGLVLVARAARDRERVYREAAAPSALTAVASTAVLGARTVMIGWVWAAVALLVVALALWLVLLAPVLANWVTPTTGASLLLTVATESIAVLAIVLAQRQGASWLRHAALVPFLLGLLFYAVTAWRLDLRQLVTAPGDHWIIGGALAIATLCAGRDEIEAVGLVLWVVTMAWLPVLLAAEVVRPRLRYHGARWSTVFPVGMYAACSFAVGAVAGLPAITAFARAWTWVAAVLWLVMFAGMVRRGLRH
jgi:tellurite resistance protein TehA-like permease